MARLGAWLGMAARHQPRRARPQGRCQARRATGGALAGTIRQLRWSRLARRYHRHAAVDGVRPCAANPVIFRSDLPLAIAVGDGDLGAPPRSRRLSPARWPAARPRLVRALCRRRADSGRRGAFCSGTDSARYAACRAGAPRRRGDDAGTARCPGARRTAAVHRRDRSRHRPPSTTVVCRYAGAAGAQPAWARHGRWQYRRLAWCRRAWPAATRTARQGCRHGQCHQSLRALVRLSPAVGRQDSARHRCRAAAAGAGVGNGPCRYPGVRNERWR